MRRRTFLQLPAVAAAAAHSAHAAPSDDTLLRAMRDENQRSLKKLQLESLEKPYFLSYRIVETNTVRAVASYGALQEASEGRRRLLAVECRVGSYEFDNSNFYAMRTAFSGVVRIQADAGAGLPVDDDYDEIRRQLWLYTDSAYKQSLDDLSKKRAALENRTRTGVPAADFSRETAHKDVESSGRIGWTADQVAKLAKDLSLRFRKAKGIDNSGARVEVVDTLTRYVSSEGAEYWREKPLLLIQFYAEGQAADGMPVSDVESLYAGSASAIPEPAEIDRRFEAFQKRVLTLLQAKSMARYAGPVLFEGAAAAELFAQGFAASLLASPRLVVDDARFEQIFGSDEGTLMDKMGTRVLPSHLKVVDDPGLTGAMGGQRVDEEGVRTKPTVLVENGMLRQMLRTRALVAGTTQSTGSRRVSGVAPGNLVVESTKPLSSAAMREQLMAMVKERNLEHGVVVRKIANPADAFARPRNRVMIITRGGPQGVTLAPVVEAVKVFPDGREEPVRNLEVFGFSLANFRDIAAVSGTPGNYSAQFRNPRVSPLVSGAIVGARVLVTLRVPDLLFEDITLQQPVGDVPKLPFVPHPGFA
jgi:hypothetical protein